MAQEMEIKIIRILLIEDYQGDARLIQEMLKEVNKNRFELFHTQSLTHGLKVLTEQEIDILLLDLILPDSKGLETLYKITYTISHIPIIVMTGIEDEDVGLKAIHEGAQDYLVKGQVNSNLLLKTINYALERNRLMMKLKQTYQQEIEEKQRIAEHYQAIIQSSERPDIDAQYSLDQKMLQQLTQKYRNIVIQYVRAVRIREDRPSERIRNFAILAAKLKVRAKDIVQIHIKVLEEFANLTLPSEEREFSNDARLVLVELMGSLLDLYRNKCLTIQT